MCAPIPARPLLGALVVTLLVVCPNLAGANRARHFHIDLNATSAAGYLVALPPVAKAANRSLSVATATESNASSLVVQSSSAEAQRRLHQPFVNIAHLDEQWPLDDLSKEAEARDPGHLPNSLPPEIEIHTEPDMTHVLAALGGGTGVRVGGLRHNELDRELVRRMRIQDKAVAIAIVALYFAFLAFGFSAKFHDSHNDSPVTYYADPRYHNLVSEGNDPDAFLDAFNQAPKNVHLQVTGFLPVAEGRGSVQWRGEHYRVAFTFALDLSPWVARANDWTDISQNMDARLPAQPLRDGVVPEDHALLSDFLEHDTNELAMIEVQKDVAWPGCEELATNIKLRIRQMGFSGIIGVNLSEGETVCVFKNAPWANFMHSRTTKVLVVLSMFGWALYFPYMWLRCRSIKIRARYRVDVAIDSYWPLIADKLSAHGFDAT